MRYAFTSLLALASAVSAVGNAVVENKSTSKFYLWSVGGAVGDRQTVEPGMYQPPMHKSLGFLKVGHAPTS